MTEKLWPRDEEEGVVLCTKCRPEGKHEEALASGFCSVDGALPALGFLNREQQRWAPKCPAQRLPYRRQAVSVHSVALNKTLVGQQLSSK